MKNKQTENDKIVVFGIYKTSTEAEIGVDSFKRAGFRAEDISALLPTGDQTKEFAHTNNTKAPEGIAAGGTTGAVLGGTLGWLAGIGTLAIPGVGPFIAAGPIMAALAGATVVGTVGALTGALVGMGMPEFEAKRYENRVEKGGILVSFHCDNSDWAKKAKKILEDTGATEISSTSEATGDSSSDSRSKDASNYY